MGQKTNQFSLSRINIKNRLFYFCVPSSVLELNLASLKKLFYTRREKRSQCELMEWKQFKTVSIGPFVMKIWHNVLNIQNLQRWRYKTSFWQWWYTMYLLGCVQMFYSRGAQPFCQTHPLELEINKWFESGVSEQGNQQTVRDTHPPGWE